MCGGVMACRRDDRTPLIVDHRTVFRITDQSDSPSHLHCMQQLQNSESAARMNYWLKPRASQNCTAQNVSSMKCLKSPIKTVESALHCQYWTMRTGNKLNSLCCVIRRSQLFFSNIDLLNDIRYNGVALCCCHPAGRIMLLSWTRNMAQSPTDNVDNRYL